jgi:hypothetical protein
MSAGDQDRAVLGFCSIAVFGASATFALQHLKHWDEAAFDSWYEPWSAARSGYGSRPPVRARPWISRTRDPWVTDA